MIAPPPSLPESWSSTRGDLHRVAVHVMARRRSDLAGKIGLRAAPGGIATPAAGPEHEVVRTSGAWLLRERTGTVARTDAMLLAGATLAQAAAFVDVDLTAPLEVGGDAPPIGEVDLPLAVDAAAASALAAWFSFGSSVLDEVVAPLGPGASSTVVQLWPEHFDAACDVVVGDGRVNLGVSPGDGGHPDPYVYIGPWGPERPGDASYWNAPFGAVISLAALRAAGEPGAVAAAFLRRGLDLLTRG